jgi:hypothetical protein
MLRVEAAMERAELDQIERVLNHELRERFTAGAVERGVLLQHGDDPAVPPGQLLVRVFIPAPDRPEDYEQALATWQDAHQAGMGTLRRELSLRLPAARLLEFTFDEPGPAAHQTPMPRITMPDDGSLAAEQLSGREIVTRALALLRANYVFPEVAERAAAAVEVRLEAGEYDQLDEIALTDLVTRHLQEVCEDKHLRLRLGGGPPPGRGPEPGPGEPKDREARRLAMRQMGRLDNFGIRRVERLDGNVGYLDLHRVPVPANAGPAIAAAMELVAGTYALIIDLRHNGGGSPEGVVFWCSYLFNEQPPISAAVHIAIPFARSVNPVTGTNWQGTGVVPDIAVPEAEAYDVAYRQALRHVLAMEDLIPPIADEARDALAGLPAADQG